MTIKEKPGSPNGLPVIVYAVAGQGRGHAAKSLALYEELKDRFDVRFFAGGEAYDFFVKKDLPVTRIACLRFRFKNNAIHLPETIAVNWPLIRNLRGILAEIRQKLQVSSPVLIISDFETFVPRAAEKLGIPVVQVSHQVVLAAGKIKIPLLHRFSWLKAYLVSRMIIGHYAHAIGVSFFDTPINRRKNRARVEIQPPIFRPEILARHLVGSPKNWPPIPIRNLSCMDPNRNHRRRIPILPIKPFHPRPFWKIC